MAGLLLPRRRFLAGLAAAFAAPAIVKASALMPIRGEKLVHDWEHTIVLGPGESATIWSDGTRWYTVWRDVNRQAMQRGEVSLTLPPPIPAQTLWLSNTV